MYDLNVYTFHIRPLLSWKTKYQWQSRSPKSSKHSGYTTGNKELKKQFLNSDFVSETDCNRIYFAKTKKNRFEFYIDLNQDVVK